MTPITLPNLTSSPPRARPGGPECLWDRAPEGDVHSAPSPLGAENCRVARTHWKPRPGQQTSARPRSLPVTPPNSSQSPQPREPRGTRRLCLSGLRWPGTRVAAAPPPPVGLLASVGFEPPHGVPSPLPRASRRRGVGSWRCGESRALRAAASAPRPLVSAGRAGVAGPRAALTRVSRVGMALSPPPPRRLAGDHREVPPTPVARLRALCAARGWHPAGVPAGAPPCPPRDGPFAPRPCLAGGRCLRGPQTCLRVEPCYLWGFAAFLFISRAHTGPRSRHL